MRTRSWDAAVLAVFAALQGWVVLQRGFYALSDDDFARVVIAQQFAHAPSLDPSGTSWLPFPFWLTGGAMWLLFRSLLVARLVAVASNVAAVILVHRAATLLGFPRHHVVLGVFLAVFLPTAGRLGVTFQPEALTAGLVVFAAATTQVDGRARLAGGAALVAATLSRYEAWPVAAAFAALCLLDARRSERTRGAAARDASIAAALAVIGPVAWLLHGVFRHGDALFFVRRVTAYRRALGEQESLLDGLLAYPAAAFRAEPELCLLAVGVVVLWLCGVVRPPRIGRFAVVLGALCVFLVASRLRGGAPTHHPERTLLAVFWGMALVGGDAVARALAALRAQKDRDPATPAGLGTLARPVALTAALAILAAGLLVRRAFPPEGDSSRADERAAGDLARKMTPSSFLVVDTPDYGYFAVIAAFGAPERAAPLARHDPRERTSAANPSSPELVASELRRACVPSSPANAAGTAAAARPCAFVVHETHRHAARLLGAPLAMRGNFSLIRGAAHD